MMKDGCFIDMLGDVHINIVGSIFSKIERDLGNGGAINGRLLGLGVIELENVKFDHCETDGSGGAIGLDMTEAGQDSLIINTCSFEYCGSEGKGGAFYMKYEKLNVIKFEGISTFKENIQRTGIFIKSDGYLVKDGIVGAEICSSSLVSHFSSKNTNGWIFEDSFNQIEMMNLIDSYCNDICVFQNSKDNCNMVSDSNEVPCMWINNICKSGTCKDASSTSCKENPHCQIIDEKCVNHVCSQTNGDPDSCEEYCTFDYTNGNQKCIIDECSAYSKNNCDNDCIVDNNKCRSRKCSEKDACDTLPFCTILGGVCVSNPCLIDGCSSSFCDSNCQQKQCSQYSLDECISVSGCVIKDNICTKEECSSLSINDCNGNNPYCKVVYNGVFEKCWEDICGDETFGCFHPYCLASEEGNCLFDECHTLHEQNCASDENCIYTNEKECHKGTCEGIDVKECEISNGAKCGVIGGVCDVNYCKSLGDEECDTMRGCEMIDGNCKMDECVWYTESECVSEEANERGCVYIHDLGRCTKGDCEMMSSNECEDIRRCKKVIEGDSIVCVTNNCSSYTVGDDCPKSKCLISADSKCIFDECHGLNSNRCKEDKNCIYTTNYFCHEENVMKLKIMKMNVV
jgi:hypothetical protein